LKQSHSPFNQNTVPTLSTDSADRIEEACIHFGLNAEDASFRQ